jgi:hypothetical protein
LICPAKRSITGSSLWCCCRSRRALYNHCHPIRVGVGKYDPLRIQPGRSRERSKIKVEVESEVIFEFATESELLNQGGARAFQVMLYYYFWTYLNYTHLVFFYHQIQSYYLHAQLECILGLAKVNCYNTRKKS